MRESMIIWSNLLEWTSEWCVNQNQQLVAKLSKSMMKNYQVAYILLVLIAFFGSKNIAELQMLGPILIKILGTY